MSWNTVWQPDLQKLPSEPRSSLLSITPSTLQSNLDSSPAILVAFSRTKSTHDRNRSSKYLLAASSASRRQSRSSSGFLVTCQSRQWVLERL